MQHYETVYQRRDEHDEESSNIHPRESRTRQDESIGSTSGAQRSSPHPSSRQPQSQQQRRAAEQRGKGKWTKTVDVSGFRPDEVKVKVDPIFHTLRITAQRATNPWHPAHQSAPTCNKLKRVVPLPENICVEKLRVHFNVEEGELLVKAPFQGREDILTKQQCHQQHDDSKDSTSCVSIPITWKSQQQQLHASVSSSFLSALQLPRTVGTTGTTGIIPCDITKLPVQEYLRLLKQSPGTAAAQQLNKNIATEVVKDENTGKWKLFIDINAVGFRREEVNVTFEEKETKERLLVVEMCHDKSKQIMPRTQQKTTTITTTQTPGGTTTQSHLQQMEHEPRMVGAAAGNISLKHVREEILLPEWLEGKQMSYRVMENGVLRIQLPCLREPYPTDREADEEKWNRSAASPTHL